MFVIARIEYQGLVQVSLIERVEGSLATGAVALPGRRVVDDREADEAIDLGGAVVHDAEVVGLAVDQALRERSAVREPERVSQLVHQVGGLEVSVERDEGGTGEGVRDAARAGRTG